MNYIKSIIILIVLASSLNAENLFNAPNGLVKSPDRALEGTEILDLEEYKSANEGIQLTIMKLSPVDNEQGKVDIVAGMISGMKNKGFRNGTTTIGDFRGHDSRHIQGEFKLEGYEGVYFADTHIIFSDDATLIFSISIDDGIGGRELGEDLLERLNMAAALLPPSNSSAEEAENRAFKIGEKIGYYGFFVIFGLGIYALIKRAK